MRFLSPFPPLCGAKRRSFRSQTMRGGSSYERPRSRSFCPSCLTQRAAVCRRSFSPPCAHGCGTSSQTSFARKRSLKSSCVSLTAWGYVPCSSKGFSAAGPTPSPTFGSRPTRTFTSAATTPTFTQRCSPSALRRPTPTMRTPTRSAARETDFSLRVTGSCFLRKTPSSTL